MPDPITATAALDAPTLPRGAAIGRPHVQETVFARDRVGTVAVLATIRPSGRGRWWWSFEVYERHDGTWEPEQGNGDQWPLDPDAPRPATHGFELATSVSGFDVGGRGVAVIGGVVGSQIAVLELETERDRHRVPVDPATGSFTAMGLTDDDYAFTLRALDDDGETIDRIEHDGRRHGDLIGPLFHLSPCENRASIVAHGLDAQRMGSSARGLAGSERPELRGVYVHDAPDEAKHWAKQMGERHRGGLDLWEIDGAGLPLLTGPHGFEYVPGAIPPERIRLRQTFTREQLEEMAAGRPGPDVFDAIDGVNGAVILQRGDDELRFGVD